MQGLAGDVTGFLRREKAHYRGYFLRLAIAPERNLRQQRLRLLRAELTRHPPERVEDERLGEAGGA